MGRPRTRLPMPLAGLALAGVLTLSGALAAALAGCGSLPRSPSGTVNVVAAENFWGSIAAQLAGTRAHVSSIIADPAEDPHSYEPTAADARTLAGARLAIVNGIGYDPWAGKLLAADGSAGPEVLSVGALFGLPTGANPHRWYDPPEVLAVAAAITARLSRLDPAGAAYYAARGRAFARRALAGYRSLLAAITSRYAGTPVGASESIVVPLANALHLRLLTPPSFMNATAEGTDVTAQDTLTVERQITSRQIAVWIYNTQNATPEVQHCTALARARGIPVVGVSETLTPASASFEQWQVGQLERLQSALRAGTGR
jgi:zinc/manganese transport system substrate-binding protein